MLFIPSSVFILLPVAVFVYVALQVFYNLFLHPLRSYPGPLLARATRITFQRQVLRGTSHYWLQDCHRKYGPVVRCAPNDLSFIDPQVWKDVYGHKATSFIKDVIFYGPDAYGNPPGLIRSDNVSHARQRKLVSNAFSDKALTEQEQLLKGHVGMLVQRLKEIASSKDDGAVDIIEWLNFTSFDIMSELAFGESLGQLKTSTYNPWVKAFFGFIKLISIGRVSREWPILKRVFDAFVPADLLAKRKAHTAFSAEQVDKRMARKSDRPDIWSYVTKYSETEGPTMAPSELHSNGSTFMLAGTETTASLLSGLTYLLLNNPPKLARLRKEVREAFSSFEDMHITRLSQLQYLQACIEEGLRLYPPVPIGMVRTTPKGGANICGRWVAGGTAVSCPNYVASRSPSNFTDPETFVPERFLPEGQARYGSDRRDAMNPFSYGPRNCVGKNLAYHEMRLILASIMLHFDLELEHGQEQWMRQESHILWDKPPLLVKLRHVGETSAR